MNVENSLELGLTKLCDCMLQEPIKFLSKLVQLLEQQLFTAEYVFLTVYAG